MPITIRMFTWGRAVADEAQEGVGADLQGEAPGEACGGSPAHCEAEVVDDLVQPRGAPAEGGQDVGGKALGEDTLPTRGQLAPEASRHDLDVDASATQGRVRGKTPAPGFGRDARVPCRTGIMPRTRLTAPRG